MQSFDYLGKKINPVMNTGKRSLIALIPIAVLIVFLALDIVIFGADSILGASQVALLCAAGVCIALSSWLYKTP